MKFEDQQHDAGEVKHITTESKDIHGSQAVVTPTQGVTPSNGQVPQLPGPT